MNVSNGKKKTMFRLRYYNVKSKQDAGFASNSDLPGPRWVHII
jgi:uncharacterized protein YodC (DUF2158 family)